MAIEHYPKLEAMAKEVLKSRGWSLRQAEIQTGISFSVIHNLSRGRRASPEFMTQWAKKIKQNPDDWLRAAGYDYFSGADESDSPAPANPALEPVYEALDEAGFPDLDEAEQQRVVELVRRKAKGEDAPERPAAPRTSQGEAPEVTREPLDEDAEEVLGWYEGMPPDDKDAARKFILFLREKNKNRDPRDE